MSLKFLQIITFFCFSICASGSEEPKLSFSEKGIYDGLYFERYGDLKKEPIFFIHGVGSSIDKFFENPEYPFIEELSKYYQIILYDQRGYGRSEISLNPDDYTLNSLARDLSHLMASLGYNSANITGFSFGARVGLQLAELFPDKIKSLIMVDMHPFQFYPEPQYFTNYKIAKEQLLTEDSKEKITKYIKALFSYYAREGNFQDTLFALNVPSLVFKAENGSSVSEERFDALLRMQAAKKQRVSHLCAPMDLIETLGSGHSIHKSMDSITLVNMFLDFFDKIKPVATTECIAASSVSAESFDFSLDKSSFASEGAYIFTMINNNKAFLLKKIIATTEVITDGSSKSFKKQRKKVFDEFAQNWIKYLELVEVEKISEFKLQIDGKLRDFSDFLETSVRENIFRYLDENSMDFSKKVYEFCGDTIKPDLDLLIESNKKYFATIQISAESLLHFVGCALINQSIVEEDKEEFFSKLKECFSI